MCHAGHNVTRDARAGTTGAASSGRGHRAILLSYLILSVTMAVILKAQELP